MIACFLLVVGLWFPVPVRCAEGVSSPFESSPIRENPAQAEWLRQKAKESQEQYRLRVQIPRAALALPLAEQPAPSTHSLEPQGSLADSAAVPGQNLMLGALLALVGLLMVLKIAPETLEKICVPFTEGRTCPASQPEVSSKVPDDEKAFAEFLVTFKAGPAARPHSKLVSPSRLAGENAAPEIKDLCEPSADPAKPFYAAIQPHLLGMRNLLAAIGRQAEQSEQRPMLKDLCARLATLKEMASIPELLPVWQVTSAIEGLVAQLAERVSNVTANTLRTVANGFDLLVDLCQPGLEPDLSTKPPIRLLAVDDDLISRHAVAFALRKAFKQPDLAANSEAALAQVSVIGYDVIFLDVLMPGMDGFELCSSVRQTPLNRLTPIVFVTSQNDFEARAASNLCGGTDLIAKPFLSFEITVKALVLALRGRLEKGKNKVTPCESAKSLVPVH